MKSGEESEVQNKMKASKHEKSFKDLIKEDYLFIFAKDGSYIWQKQEIVKGTEMNRAPMFTYSYFLKSDINPKLVKLAFQDVSTRGTGLARLKKGKKSDIKTSLAIT